MENFPQQNSLWNVSLFVFQLNGATYKSETKFSGGGVGRNIAEGLEKLNGSVALISAFGRDQNGEFLRKTLSEQATNGSKISETPTANCAIILDNFGGCKLCVGNMSIHGEITPELVSMKKFPSRFKTQQTSSNIPIKTSNNRISPPLSDLQKCFTNGKITAYLHRLQFISRSH